jgi:phosphoribosylanthranilate isomerase
MTWVKICGMTNLEDALVAVDAGADAVGFVFYEKSPRCVTVETVREIASRLPENLEKVGVFVNESGERIRALAADAALTAVQIYGSPPPSQPSEETGELVLNNFKVIVAIPSDRLVPGGIITGSLSGSVVHALLLDSGSGERPGGTGTKFDWGRNREYVRTLGTALQMKIIVAGGLTSENVVEAIETFAPWGVDVVSGVEASPGKKDPEKVRAFMRAVREMDRRVG